MPKITLSNFTSPQAVDFKERNLFKDLSKALQSTFFSLDALKIGCQEMRQWLILLLSCTDG
jgi:hypothetical protein